MTRLISDESEHKAEPGLDLMAPHGEPWCPMGVSRWVKGAWGQAFEGKEGGKGDK